MDRLFKEQLYNILAITYNREISDFTRIEYSTHNTDICVHASEIFERQKGLIRELCNVYGYNVHFTPGPPGIHYINLVPI